MTMEERKAKIAELTAAVQQAQAEIQELSYGGWKPSQRVLVPALVSNTLKTDGCGRLLVAIQPNGDWAYVDPFSLLPDDRF